MVEHGLYKLNPYFRTVVVLVFVGLSVNLLLFGFKTIEFIVVSSHKAHELPTKAVVQKNA